MRINSLLILVLGILFSGGGFMMAWNSENLRLKAVFEREVEENAAEIKSAIDDNLQTIRALEAFYNASEYVSRQEFENFSRHLLRHMKALHALEWVPKISRQDAGELVRKAAEEGVANFQIRAIHENGPQTPRHGPDFYCPVFYVEPQADNENSLGLDLCSSPERLEILQRAEQEKAMVLSQPIRLIPAGNSFGFISAVPIYSSDSGEMLKGYVLGVFKLDRVLKTVLEKNNGLLISLKPNLYEEDDQSVPEIDEDLTAQVLEENFSEVFVTTREVRILENQKLNLVFRSAPDWAKGKRRPYPWIVLFLGIVGAIFISAYLHLFQGYARKIEGAVKDRTRDLESVNAALQEKEAKFRSLVSNIPGAVYRCAADKDWTMNFISDYIQQITGYPAADFIQSCERTFSQIIYPEDCAYVEAGVKQALQNKDRYVLEYRILHADGSVRWVYEQGQGVFSSQDELLYLEGVIFDITDKKKMSEQVIQSEKIDAVGKLAGGIAHDFNNLLMVMTGYLNLISQSLKPSDHYYMEIEEIKKAAERSVRLTRQLLTLSRKQVPKMDSVDLNALIQNFEEMIKSFLGEAAELEIRLAPDLGFVKADPGQFEQVLMNFAINARDSILEKGTGSGTLTIQTHAEKYSEEETRPCLGMPAGDYAVLSFRDTGMGMSEEVKKHLFEPFFTTKPKGKGTGLGLATCYGIIRTFGGFIQVSSRLKQGTLIEIFMPRIPKPSVKKEEVPVFSAQPSALHNWSILVVEDEDAVRQMVIRVLQMQGCRWKAFDRAQPALDWISQGNRADILLTDIVMPGMNGKELGSKVKKMRPDMRILYMSGYPDCEILKDGESDFKGDFLHKPFAPEQLSQRIRKMMEDGGTRYVTPNIAHR